MNGNATEQYNYEMDPAVAGKIVGAQDLHRLIPEEALAGLQPVDLSKSRYRAVKRLLDVVISLLALAVLLLPMGIVALAIFVDDPGWVIFRQNRVGRNGKNFKIYKFRSMRKDTPKYLSTAEVGDPEKYITRLGHFLRSSSIDELPQLFNVLRGNMSLVGPRPLIADEFEIHSMRLKYGVYAVRPGMTGLAQINGRDTVEPAEKVKWDVRYLQHFGFVMDAKILLLTFQKVLGHSGVVEGYNFKDCTHKEKNAKSA